MYLIWVLSPQAAVQTLLGVILDGQNREIRGSSQPDDILPSLADRLPVCLIVDLRDADDDLLLFSGIMRRRHPEIPVITLLDGCVRIFKGKEERLFSTREGWGPERLQSMFMYAKELVERLVADQALATWRPAPGMA